jgi:hypothetical protein
MTGTFTQCDQCGEKSVRVTDMIAGRDAKRWITISRPYSTSEDWITGTRHFCCDICCVEWINQQAAEDAPNASLSHEEGGKEKQ